MSSELDADMLPMLRERIFDVLKDADLSSVSAKKIRTEMSEMPEGSLPAGLDLAAQKKAIDAVIRQCYEEFTSKKKPSAKTKKSAEPKEKKTKKRASADEKDGEPKKKRVASENSPLKRPMKLSQEMAEVCGGSEMPRYEVVKQLWVYIKDKNLQNESNKRQVRVARLTQILCDEKLTSLFGKSAIEYVRPLTPSSFEMAKLIGPHLTKIEPPAP
ncbi:hypothetical protein MCAP1_000266 [Malassezia caprae]|uniref:DM2 domain-containing protein n=1 Tax=Malassezia caprae TaxID=1381934 RepID=A0AAF0ITP6_9BASI|nr:hypothetical protein MCAP1_000266 [Malassezia caprae]